MGLIVQIINKSTILPKAQELQICSKQASIHEKMQFIVQLIEKEVLLLLLVQLQLLFLMMNRLYLEIKLQLQLQDEMMMHV